MVVQLTIYFANRFPVRKCNNVREKNKQRITSPSWWLSFRSVQPRWNNMKQTSLTMPHIASTPENWQQQQLQNNLILRLATAVCMTSFKAVMFETTSWKHWTPFMAAWCPPRRWPMGPWSRVDHISPSSTKDVFNSIHRKLQLAYSKKKTTYLPGRPGKHVLEPLLVWKQPLPGRFLAASRSHQKWRVAATFQQSTEKKNDGNPWLSRANFMVDFEYLYFIYWNQTWPTVKTISRWRWRLKSLGWIGMTLSQIWLLKIPLIFLIIVLLM